MADLKADNILVAFEDDSVIQQYVNQQQQSEPLKEIGENVVYESRADFGPIQKGMLLLKIADFGSAFIAAPSKLYFHRIQPEGFQAPEVLLNAGWTYSADLWNLGIVLWELLQDEPLTLGRHPGSGSCCRRAHMAQLYKLFGPPPEALLLRANEEAMTSLCTSDGQFEDPKLAPPEKFNWDNLVNALIGEEKAGFLLFASKMLKWMPEERATAEELSKDPWLVG